MAELWTQREDTGPRAQVVSNGLDFDSDRGVAVLLGWPPLSSNPAQTWEWDGGSWVQVDDMGPSGGMVVFMPDRHALLAHSNVSGSKTWERKNEVWTQVADTGPMAVGLAYDQSRSRAVAFAFDSTLSVFETWEWDGTAWTVVADSGPSGRNSLGLAYDAKNKVTVLFGGFDPKSKTPLGDTWAWDGKRWKQVSDMGPSARMSPGFAYDDNQERSLLFGGQAGTTLYGDTWTWDGKLWRQVSDMGPAPREAPGFCFDGQRQRAVLFGGSTGTFCGDTWEYFDHT